MRVVRRVLARLVVAARRRWLTLIGLVLFVLVAAAGLALRSLGFAVGPPAETPAPSDPSSEREVTVTSITQVRPSQAVWVELKERQGSRTLVIEVSPIEGVAIAGEVAGEQLEQRPTYDLMRNLVQGMGGRISRVVLDRASDTAFFAKVVVETGAGEVRIDARPSDAIALALRSRAPIYADAAVLDQAGVRSRGR